MSTTPRRYLLPICLASLLLVACGVAGYYGFTRWQSSDSAENPEVADDLNDGFADSSAPSGPDKTDRWVETPPAASSAPESVAGSPPAQLPLASEYGPLPPLEGAKSDRYVEQTVAIEPAPPETEAPLPPLDAGDRYADSL